VDVENKYYNAKQLKAEDPESAIDEFLGVPPLEEEKGDWYGPVADVQVINADAFTGDSKVSSRQLNWNSSLRGTIRFAALETDRDAPLTDHILGRRTFQGASYLR
jgi:hypothetical protein